MRLVKKKEKERRYEENRMVDKRRENQEKKM